MNLKLYQIDMDRDEHYAAYMGLDSMDKLGIALDPTIYDKVFDGEVDCTDLEDVFRTFNTDHPADYTGRSMSVSDVAEEDGRFFFCDSVGFKEIDFDPSQCRNMVSIATIRVILLEPGKNARVANIESSLESMQAVVGGSIEAVYPFDEPVAIVCNEEGKLMGLPLNRALRGDDGRVYDILAGTAFVCDCSGDNFGSLSDKQVLKYTEEFRHPERFIRYNGEIMAVPYHPKEPNKGDAR